MGTRTVSGPGVPGGFAQTMAGVPVLLAVLVAVLVAGCGTSRVGRENDRLRRLVHDLEGEVALLESRNRELSTELTASAAPASLSEEVRASTPHVSGMIIGGLGHVRASDANGGARTLVLYIQPTDGLGRFVQFVGDLSVNAAVLPEDGPARTVGQRALSPGELRATYRSGLAGTHYTVEVPLTDTGRATAVDVRVFYTDGRTGRSLEASRSILLAPAR